MAETLEHLNHIDGVMMGREAYTNPYILAEVDKLVYGDEAQVLTRHQAVRAMFDYIENHMLDGGRFWQVVRHMLGIFQGMPGARGYRRYLSENGHKPDANIAVLEQALSFVPEA